MDWKTVFENCQTADLFNNNYTYKAISLSGFFPLEPLHDFSEYIFSQLKDNEVAYGGYLEKRTVYQQSPIFLDANKEARSIHLGTDFWQKAGTKVYTPLDGVFMGKTYNEGLGNYGGTCLVKHTLHDKVFYTLYGHINVDETPFEKGDVIEKGSYLTALGNPEINGGWPPHLHFQVITELNENEIDFPGVCLPSEQELFKKTCLNPNYLLKYC